MRPSTRFVLLLIPLMAFIFLQKMIIEGKVPLASDLVAYEPIREWAQGYVEREEGMPQWFPHLFAGMPSYAGYVYVPSNPVHQLLQPIFVNRGLRYWFHFALGGIGVFLILRRRKLGLLPSIFGGLVFSLTPYLFGLINAGHSGKIFAFGYLPYVILGVDYVLSSSSWRGILYLGLATALQLWTRHPQIVYYTWMLVAFLWLSRQIIALLKKKWALRREGKQTVVLIASVLLALILATDPYASIFQFLGHSTRGAASVLDKSGDTGKGVGWDYATEWSFHPKEMISFVYPYFYGLQNYPTRDLKSAAYWGYMPFTQSTHFLGLLTLLLAILGMIIRRPSAFSVSLIIVSLLILLVGFGKYFPVLFWPLFKFAPMFSRFRVPSMIFILLPFTVGILAAVGLENLTSVLANRNQDSLTRLRKWGVLVFGTVILLSLVLLLLGDSLGKTFGLFLKNGDPTRFEPQVLVQLREVREQVFQKGLLLALFIASGGLVAIWLGIRGNLKAHSVGIILVGISVIDFWVIDQEFLHLKNPSSLRKQFRPTAEVRFLKQDEGLFRILPVDNFNTNWYGYFGLSSVGGYRPVKLRTYQDLMDAGGLNNVSVLNMLNVKYLITARDLQSRQFHRVFEGEKWVYENISVLPRVWTVGEIIPASSQKESLEKTLDGDFDPATRAVVVNYDGPEVTSGYGDSTKITHFSENEIELEVRTAGDRLLVLSENYYEPGWKASVNGKKTEIYQTNHVLRSVFVPEGSHSVTFQYDSSLFRVSRLVSRISLVLVLVAVVLVHRKTIGSFFSSLRKK